jgi:hypothetical protein
VEVNPTPQTASNSTHDIGHAQALEAADKTEDNLSIESKAKEVNPTSRPASNITHDNELAQALEAPDETEDNSSIESKTEKPNPTSQPLSSITDDQEFTRTYHPLEWLEDNPSHKLAGKVRTLPNPELKYLGGMIPMCMCVTLKRRERNQWLLHCKVISFSEPVEDINENITGPTFGYGTDLKVIILISSSLTR